ncbi:MAG TPA: hypothetical protein VJV23_15475 [Candidatus Polarisedimenticolia bacterium]|nr:hypothetical protein [Candidatus Polarisedimenticolia bacterium]
MTRRKPAAAASLLPALLLAAAFLAPPPPARAHDPGEAECVCRKAGAAGVWCDRHALGHLAGLTIRSKMLFEALDAHGHELDLSTFRCPACRRAIETDGYCDEHRTGFVGKLAYFSRLTYELARGELRDPAGISCPDCRRLAGGGQGWCGACRLGMLGPVAIRDRSRYETAARAAEIVREADLMARRCEHCALAMVADDECPFCRITYKDGRPAKTRQPAAVPSP